MQIFALICRACRAGGCRAIFLHAGQMVFLCVFAAGCGGAVPWGEERRLLPVWPMPAQPPAVPAGTLLSHQTWLVGSGSSHGAGPQSVRFQALGKGFEDRCVPEEGDRWCVHPGGGSCNIPCPKSHVPRPAGSNQDRAQAAVTIWPCAWLGRRPHLGASSPAPRALEMQVPTGPTRDSQLSQPTPDHDLGGGRGVKMTFSTTHSFRMNCKHTFKRER